MYSPQEVSACFYARGRTIPCTATVFVRSRSNLCSWCSPLFACGCPMLAREGAACWQCGPAAGLAPCSFGGPCSGTLPTPLTHVYPGLLPSPIGEHGPAQRPVPQECQTASVSPPSRVSDLHGGTPRSTHKCRVCLLRGSCTPNHFAARHRSSPSLTNAPVQSRRQRDSSALTAGRLSEAPSRAASPSLFRKGRGS